jgi:hypothetical protein
LTETVSRAFLAAILSTHSHGRMKIFCYIVRITAGSMELVYLSKEDCIAICSVADPGSVTRYLFDHLIRIREKFFPDPGSNPYFLRAK